MPSRKEDFTDPTKLAEQLQVESDVDRRNELLDSAEEHFRTVVGALTDIQHAVNDVAPSPDSMWHDLFQDLTHTKDQLLQILQDYRPDSFSLEGE